MQLTVFVGKIVYDATRDATGEQAIEKEHGVELDLSGDEGYRGNFTTGSRKD